MRKLKTWATVLLLSLVGVGCATTPTYVVDVRSSIPICFTEFGWDSSPIPCDTVASYETSTGVVRARDGLETCTDVIDEVGRKTLIWDWSKSKNWSYAIGEWRHEASTRQKIAGAILGILVWFAFLIWLLFQMAPILTARSSHSFIVEKLDDLDRRLQDVIVLQAGELGDEISKVNHGVATLCAHFRSLLKSKNIKGS